jgi:hypothetical protein
MYSILNNNQRSLNKSFVSINKRIKRTLVKESTGKPSVMNTRATKYVRVYDTRKMNSPR